MSRTPFRMPQRPEAPATKLDQWVVGGEGETALPETTARPERSAGKMARLTIDLPPELHARFQVNLRPQRHPDDRRGAPVHRGLDTEKRGLDTEKTDSRVSGICLKLHFSVTMLRNCGNRRAGKD